MFSSLKEEEEYLRILNRKPNFFSAALSDETTCSCWTSGGLHWKWILIHCYSWSSSTWVELRTSLCLFWGRSSALFSPLVLFHSFFQRIYSNTFSYFLHIYRCPDSNFLLCGNILPWIILIAVIRECPKFNSRWVLRGCSVWCNIFKTWMFTCFYGNLPEVISPEGLNGALFYFQSI